jgi:hypothetical protein
MGWMGGKKKREIDIRDKVRGLICREAQGWIGDIAACDGLGY